jgi:16S rRNA (uracil1498-N3)-methyltransferase
MHSFFCDTLKDNIITLNEEESTHATRVLRLEVGDDISLLDGKGKRALATITQPHHKRCVVEVNGEVYYEVPAISNLHIAIAPTKIIDRFEWFLEKATEIGVHKITPLLTDNSERKVLNHERLHKILVAAMKQSQRLYLPELTELTTFDKFIQSIDRSQQLFIAHCEENEKKLFSNIVDKSKNCCVLVGPEGDFNSDEINVALSNNFQPISLGNSRLRTETAGVYVSAVFNS